VVIGGGPGGYVGAIRAAQLGYKTASSSAPSSAASASTGAASPPRPCSPTPSSWRSSPTRTDWGLKIKGEVEFDWDKVIGRSREVAEKLNGGVGFLMKKNKIEHITASAKIVAPRKGKLALQESSSTTVRSGRAHRAPAKPAGKTRETITADQRHHRHRLGRPRAARSRSSARRQDLGRARGDVQQGEAQAKLIVVGSGAIGMEFGYFYNSSAPRSPSSRCRTASCPSRMRRSAAMQRHYKKAGIDIKTGTITTNVEKTGKAVKVTVAPFKDGKADESKAETIEGDKVLVAIGVKGRYDGLFDDSLGLETEKDHIKTDYVPATTATEAPTTTRRTSRASTPSATSSARPGLAHVASEEAILCVERIAWRDGKEKHEPIPLDYSVIPGCTYCNPQVASRGLHRASALKEKGLKKGEDYEVGKFPFSALGKAIASAHTEGFVKIIRGLPRGEILGAHIMGDQATELIAEMSLARRLEATTEELIAHGARAPDDARVVHEAALARRGPRDSRINGSGLSETDIWPQ
jgi:dihydrolipoamide dehydrogenase